MKTMNKKLAFALTASALLGTTALATAAPDCSHVSVPGGQVSLALSSTEKLLLVTSDADIDLKEKTVCYVLQGNGKNDQQATTVNPVSVCTYLGNTPAKDTKVTVTFTNGMTKDLTAQFGIVASKKLYDAKVPPACKSPTSFSVPQTQKGLVLGL